jgi:hypothetical protein
MSAKIYTNANRITTRPRTIFYNRLTEDNNIGVCNYPQQLE